MQKLESEGGTCGTVQMVLLTHVCPSAGATNMNKSKVESTMKYVIQSKITFETSRPCHTSYVHHNAGVCARPRKAQCQHHTAIVFPKHFISQAGHGRHGQSAKWCQLAVTMPSLHMLVANP